LPVSRGMFDVGLVMRVLRYLSNCEWAMVTAAVVVARVFFVITHTLPHPSNTMHVIHE